MEWNHQSVIVLQPISRLPQQDRSGTHPVGTWRSQIHGLRQILGCGNPICWWWKHAMTTILFVSLIWTTFLPRFLVPMIPLEHTKRNHHVASGRFGCRGILDSPGCLLPESGFATRVTGVPLEFQWQHSTYWSLYHPHGSEFEKRPQESFVIMYAYISI